MQISVLMLGWQIDLNWINNPFRLHTTWSLIWETSGVSICADINCKCRIFWHLKYFVSSNKSTFEVAGEHFDAQGAQKHSILIMLTSCHHLNIIEPWKYFCNIALKKTPFHFYASLMFEKKSFGFLIGPLKAKRRSFMWQHLTKLN